MHTDSNQLCRWQRQVQVLVFDAGPMEQGRMGEKSGQRLSCLMQGREGGGGVDWGGGEEARSFDGEGGGGSGRLARKFKGFGAGAEGVMTRDGVCEEVAAGCMRKRLT